MSKAVVEIFSTDSTQTQSQPNYSSSSPTNSPTIFDVNPNTNTNPTFPVVITATSSQVKVTVTAAEVEKICQQNSEQNTEQKPLTFSDFTPSAFISRFMDIKSLNPVVKSFLVGSISGTCSTVLFQPLDLLKTRLQAPMLGNGSSGLFTVAGHIVRDEKLTGLWRGMVPSLTRCVPGVGLYFASIHGLRIFLNIDDEPTPLQSGFLGVTGRCISGVTMIPFTVIKCRYESKVYQYTSIREALQLIYMREGVRGLTCGLLPTLLRDAPFSGLYFMMYTATKKFVPKEYKDSNTLSPYFRFSCGIIAGCGASLVTQPADVIKTKMQLYPDKFHSVVQVIPYVYKKYGAKGYFKGLMPRMVRRTLVAAMSWTVYEQLMHNFGLK